MVAALFDTNILIDFLRGIPAARQELGRYQDRAISIVTWMEVLAGTPPGLDNATRRFLDGFTVVALEPVVAERAVAIRRDHRMKLPDAIVWASAQAGNRILVTRDERGFPVDDPGVRVPYRV